MKVALWSVSVNTENEYPETIGVKDEAVVRRHGTDGYTLRVWGLLRDTKLEGFRASGNEMGKIVAHGNL